MLGPAIIEGSEALFCENETDDGGVEDVMSGPTEDEFADDHAEDTADDDDEIDRPSRICCLGWNAHREDDA